MGARSGTPRALDWPTASFSDRIMWRPCADHGRKHDTGDVVLRCESGEPAGLVLLDEEVADGAGQCVSAPRRGKALRLRRTAARLRGLTAARCREGGIGAVDVAVCPHLGGRRRHVRMCARR